MQLPLTCSDHQSPNIRIVNDQSSTANNDIACGDIEVYMPLKPGQEINKELKKPETLPSRKPVFGTPSGTTSLAAEAGRPKGPTECKPLPDSCITTHMECTDFAVLREMASSSSKNDTKPKRWMKLRRFHPSRLCLCKSRPKDNSSHWNGKQTASVTATPEGLRSGSHKYK